jgi:spermidine synthase
MTMRWFGANNDHASRLAFLLHFAAFLSGFVTMALEMLIGRTFIPYFGGTIYTWGALISVFLTGMTLGYMLGGKAADRWPDIPIVAALFLAAAALVVVVPLYGEDAINRILDSIDDMRYAALVASLALACLPAALYAAISPYCVRLLLDRKDHSGTISGRLSGLATAGSIVGTLGTSFFFIPTLGVRMIYGLLASASVVMGLILLLIGLSSYGQARSKKRPIVASIVVCVTLAAGTGPDDARAQAPSMMMLRDGQIEKVDSEYNTIFVEKQGSLISLDFGYRQNRYTESVIDLQHRDDLVVTYTRYMTASLAYQQGPLKRIALVGLGGGRTISYLVASLPGVVADVAELDPAVISLAKKYFGVDSTDRLHIHNRDGRVFLNQTKDKFDVILLDAYRGPFVPFHLTTQEFYRLVKSRLNEGGVVAQNVEPSTMFFDSAYTTMKSVFDQVDAIEAGGNIVLIGYSGARLSPQDLARKAAAAQERLKTRYDLRELVKARKDVTIASDAKILTDDFAPVEMLKTVKRHNEKRE